jgi:hypothetical protein
LLHGSISAIVSVVLESLSDEDETQTTTRDSSDSSIHPRRRTHRARGAVTTEDVYICGRETKKGTPCSRRVHGPVRCWQHKGCRRCCRLRSCVFAE